MNGVAQFFRSDGFVCSGTLINPRTVLFAAHCVNDIPETQYANPNDPNNVDAAWFFNADALSDFRNWARRFVDADGNPTNTDTGIAKPNFRTTNIANFASLRLEFVSICSQTKYPELTCNLADFSCHCTAAAVLSLAMAFKHVSTHCEAGTGVS